jgi:hypothetical protein
MSAIGFMLRRCVSLLSPHGPEKTMLAMFSTEYLKGVLIAYKAAMTLQRTFLDVRKYFMWAVLSSYMLSVCFLSLVMFSNNSHICLDLASLK